MQTGAKHGNHDVTYVEYMCAAVERCMIIGGQESYLNHVKFRTQNHAEKVCKTFDEKIPDLNAPIPCPTQSHTMDFNCTYMGAHLIDGECKGYAPPNVASGRIKVTFHELPKYALEAVTDINVDLDGNNAELADPPTYSIPDDNGGYIVEYEETHQRIRAAWDAMRSKQKKIVNAILHAIDII